jgi:hypothetical protein
VALDAPHLTAHSTHTIPVPVTLSRSTACVVQPGAPAALSWNPGTASLPTGPPFAPLLEPPRTRLISRTSFLPWAPPGVLKTFKDIATAAGASSQERKKGLISKLLVASRGAEPGYIMRSLQVGRGGVGGRGRGGPGLSQGDVLGRAAAGRNWQHECRYVRQVGLVCWH